MASAKVIHNSVAVVDNAGIPLCGLKAAYGSDSAATRAGYTEARQAYEAAAAGGLERRRPPPRARRRRVPPARTRPFAPSDGPLGRPRPRAPQPPASLPGPQPHALRAPRCRQVLHGFAHSEFTLT